MIQTIIALVAVASAVVYLAIRMIRSLCIGTRTACAGGCECSHSRVKDSDRRGRRIELLSIGLPNASSADSPQER